MPMSGTAGQLVSAQRTTAATDLLLRFHANDFGTAGLRAISRLTRNGA